MIGAIKKKGGNIMNYEITYDTQVIAPIDSETSRVIETEAEYIVNNPPLNILEYSCEYFGSSYEGRLKWSKEILKTRIKLPVIIEESKNIIFFPTRSISNNDCIWLSYNNITRIERNGNSTNVFFNDNRVYSIDVSYDILDRQIYNCLRLEKELLSRRNTA